MLTVRSVEATCSFYARVLGMSVVTFGEGRKALAFGSQEINLHEQGREFEPKAERPTPGSADLCFPTDVLAVAGPDVEQRRRWRYHEPSGLVEELRAEVVRASSLVENLNSRLRNDFHLRREGRVPARAGDAHRRGVRTSGLRADRMARYL